MAKNRYELSKNLKQGNDPLQGKSLRERLAGLPDYVPTVLKREMSQNFCDTNLMVGG